MCKAKTKDMPEKDNVLPEGDLAIVWIFVLGVLTHLVLASITAAILYTLFCPCK
jgi:hypothetical protein